MRLFLSSWEHGDLISIGLDHRHRSQPVLIETLTKIPINERRSTLALKFFLLCAGNDTTHWASKSMLIHTYAPSTSPE